MYYGVRRGNGQVSKYIGLNLSFEYGYAELVHSIGCFRELGNPVP
jgi:hypothetical protein